MEYEKRAYKRLKDSIQVKYELTDIEEFIPMTTYTKNISQGGILFRTSNLLEIGRNMSLKFFLPSNSEFIKADARVVRVEEIVEDKIYDIGIKFINIAEKDIDKLAKYVTNKI